MDGTTFSITPLDLYRRLANAAAPLLIDVRRGDSFLADDRLIIGGFHRSPTDVEHWRRELPADRPVVAYCGHGGQSSQSVVNALRAAGVDAVYLEGGVSAWKAAALPTRKKLPA